MAVHISMNESVGRFYFNTFHDDGMREAPDVGYNVYSVKVNAHCSITADQWFHSPVSLMCLEILMDM